MLTPTFISQQDRSRLAEVNQLLLGSTTTQEAMDLRLEQKILMDKRRSLQECTLDELSELRTQLFEQYRKHASIGSNQTRLIQSYIQQVEYRQMLINLKRVDEPEESEYTKQSKIKNKDTSTDGSYSWSISIDDDF